MLPTLVGKRVVVEWIGVDPPQPEEGEDMVDELVVGQAYLSSSQIGKMAGVILEDYDQYGIKVRRDVEHWPFFIAWNAVLEIRPLEEPE
jgi:hypothetical protein